MKTITPILLFSLMLFACDQANETKTTNNPPSENTNEIDSTENPKVEEESKTLPLNYLQLITTEFFDNTTEGIGSTELKTLLNEKESEYWTVSGETNNTIIFNCKIPSSQVFVQWFTKPNNQPIFIVLTNNEQASSLNLFSQSENELSESNDLLPEIKVDKFYEKNYLASMMVFEGVNYNYFLSAHNEVLIGLNPGEHLEELGEPEYYLQLQWNDEQLEYIQIPVTP